MAFQLALSITISAIPIASNKQKSLYHVKRDADERSRKQLTKLGSELGSERLVNRSRLDGRLPELTAALGGLALSGAPAIASQIAAQPRVQRSKSCQNVRVRSQHLQLAAKQFRRLHRVASAAQYARV